MNSLRMIHDQLLESVANRSSDLGAEQLTTFFPRKGMQATGELMVIGRAVNGGTQRWTADEPSNPVRRAEIVHDAVTSSTRGDKCPMQWVSDEWGSPSKTGKKNNRKRSAFWNVVREVITSLEPETSTSWTSYLIWSDLYKVAPSAGGNPSTRLIRAQQSHCFRHLQEEFLIWKPRRALFLTGYDWFKPFLPHLGISTQRFLTPEKLAQWCGSITLTGIDTPIQAVVAVHPQVYKRAKVVQEILDGFASFESVSEPQLA